MAAWQEDRIEYDPEMHEPLALFVWLVYYKYVSVNTLTGTITQLRNFKTGYDLEKPEELTPIKYGKYYRITVEVWGPGRKIVYRVHVKLHRLIYTMHHGGIPYGKDIHHKDKKTENNGYRNLIALYPSEHVQVNKETEVYKHLKNAPAISSDDPVVAKILDLHKSGLSYRQIGQQVGYSYSTCGRIICGTYKFADSTTGSVTGGAQPTQPAVDGQEEQEQAEQEGQPIQPHDDDDDEGDEIPDYSMEEFYPKDYRPDDPPAEYNPYDDHSYGY